MNKSLLLSSLIFLPALSFANVNWLFPNPLGPKTLSLVAGSTFSHTFKIQAVTPTAQGDTLFVNFHADSPVSEIQNIKFYRLASSGINCSTVNIQNNTVTCSGIPKKGNYVSPIVLTATFFGQAARSVIRNFTFIVN